MRDLFVQRINIQTVRIAQHDIKQVDDIVARGGFIKGDAHGVMNVATQVNLCGIRTCQHRRFICDVNAQRVEVVLMTQLQAFLLQATGQNIRQTVDAAGNAFQPNRAVEDGVQAGDVCQQNLRSTDIRVRFLAADMLLASLHRHAQRGVTGGIFRYANNAARHGTFKFIFRAKECRVRSAVAHRHAETLGRAEYNIRTLFARSRQQHQRHKISGNADHHFAGFQLGNQCAVIMHFAGGTHLL